MGPVPGSAPPSSTSRQAQVPRFLEDLERWYFHNLGSLAVAQPDPKRMRNWVQVEISIVAGHAGLVPHWAYGNGPALPTARYSADYADLDGYDQSVSLYDVPVAPFEPSLAEARWLYEHVSHRLLRLYHTAQTVTPINQPDATLKVGDRTLIAVLPTFLTAALEDLLRDMNLTNFYVFRSEQRSTVTDQMSMLTVRVPARQ